MATGVILLLFVLAVNLLSAPFPRAVRRISSRQPRGKRPARESRLRGSAARLTRRIRDWFGALGSRIRICRIGQGVAVFAGVAVAAVLVLIIGFILVKGLPYLVRNPSLIWGRFEFGGEKVTILPAIITTLYAVGLSLLIAVPVGIMTAVFLNEYARRDNPLIRLIRSAIDILSGVPSIVYGLFGMITFVKLFGGSSSILAGSLDREHDAAALPSCARRRKSEIRPGFQAEGSLALGAGKLRTIFKIVLPSALPGILSAVILSMGRVISESAPFLYTMGSVISAVPHGVSDSGASLAVALYQLSGEGWYMNEAYATAVVLILLVLTLNLLAELAASRLSRKLKGASK